MSDYSDLIFLMGGMVILSILSLNMSNYYRINEQFQYQSEIVYSGILVAKDVIDETRLIADKRKFDVNHSSCICKDYPKTIPVQFSTGSGDPFLYEVNLKISDANISGAVPDNKIIEITVDSEYIPENQTIRMEYIKSFAN